MASRRQAFCANKRSQPRFPKLNRRSHLVHVSVAIVNGSNARNRAADMVEQALDDVRGDPKFGQICGERPTKIMKGPSSYTA